MAETVADGLGGVVSKKVCGLDMIGNAPGDLKAARGNQALFYPIIPDRRKAGLQT